MIDLILKIGEENLEEVVKQIPELTIEILKVKKVPTKVLMNNEGRYFSFNKKRFMSKKKFLYENDINDELRAKKSDNKIEFFLNKEMNDKIDLLFITEREYHKKLIKYIFSLIQYRSQKKNKAYYGIIQLSFFFGLKKTNIIFEKLSDIIKKEKEKHNYIPNYEITTYSYIKEDFLDNKNNIKVVVDEVYAINKINKFNKEIVKVDETLAKLIKMAKTGLNIDLKEDKFKRDSFSGRFHSPITCMKKENRSNIMVYNKFKQLERNVEIDFSNSAPFHFFLYLENQNLFKKQFYISRDIEIKKEYKKEINEFSTASKNGTFYELLQNKIGDALVELSKNEKIVEQLEKKGINKNDKRSIVKLIAQFLLFSIPQHPICIEMEKYTPGLLDVLKQAKYLKYDKNINNKDTHKTSSMLMQKVELYFVEKIINECYKKRINITTIHDSILCALSEKEEVINIIKQQYGTFEIPALKFKEGTSEEKIIGDKVEINNDNFSFLTKKQYIYKKYVKDKEEKNINQLLLEADIERKKKGIKL